MFGQTTILIAIIGLVMLSAGGVAYVLLYGRLRAERNVAARMAQVGAGSAALKQAKPRMDAARRRKSVQETLKEIEEKQKAKARQRSTPSLSMRLTQAGLSWSRNGFMLFSVACGLVAALVTLLLGAPLWSVAVFAVVGVVGVPRWYLNFRRKRRTRKFLAEFANAMDVIVRGVRAGLPLNDCIRIIASEAAEPVKSEFMQIAESQALGVSIADAVAKLPDRVPIPEANFFAIVIAIQARAGGNLSEALANLSRVLRERIKMQGKIKAMSMEAKSSAMIIGALPIIVMGLVYLTSPDYIMLLFTEPLGNIILAASAIWMLMGVLVMRRMINFDF
ncbi:MAG: type II secretion system F family protein [Hyphomonas sp.]|uniref:type II secretion system F family protein n=1 Tax=Bauldia sp. TaxID=2575872 RepID=UPI001D7CAAEC|nr:type II secretion system F family protein [Bauldia sp.]MCA8905615.1 type II secretion system F family protein [Hyphomonas sp.]MCB1496738.1 type II secretion system F family protein [Bauldia sp.]